jgi:hypothetical protein
MVGALEPIKEIHAIRLKLQDEYAGMTAEEKTKLRNKRAVEFLAGIGSDPHLVSFPGRGKLKPGGYTVTRLLRGRPGFQGQDCEGVPGSMPADILFNSGFLCPSLKIFIRIGF